jgi:hypothetical protein
MGDSHCPELPPNFRTHLQNTKTLYLKRQAWLKSIKPIDFFFPNKVVSPVKSEMSSELRLISYRTSLSPATILHKVYKRRHGNLSLLYQKLLIFHGHLFQYKRCLTPVSMPFVVLSNKCIL